MHTSVLIVGAGPTGLLMACQLRQLGIDCVIADSKEGPTEQSRALVVQPRSLEIYEQMGIVQQTLAEGAPMRKVGVFGPHGQISSLPFQHLGDGLSRYSEALVFEQSKNEKLLYGLLRQLGTEVLWQHELTELNTESKGFSASFKKQDGTTLQLTADWLIGADGARSFVRHHLDLGFTGATYEHIFFVADTALPDTDGWSHESLSIYLARNTFLGLLPMPGNRRFRAIGVLPKEFQNENPEHFEIISPLIEGAVKLPLHFEDTRWFSIYRLHHRHAAHFRAGRAFLAGDAAHIHSPVGGQGMNTGLQDAYNLAWKLAFVIRGLLRKEVLESYEQERMPVAEVLLKTTDKIFSMVNSQRFFPTLLRTQLLPRVLPVLMRTRAVGRWLFRSVSQIGIHYPNSMLSGASAFSSLKKGMRLPYVPLPDGSALQDRIQSMKFHLLVLGTKEQSQSTQSLFAGFSNELMEVVHIPESSIAENMGLRGPAAILVRPDHHIAMATPLNQVAGIKSYLERIAVKQG